MALPLSLILKFAVLVLAVPFLMLQWGYTWPDIREWYRQLFFGLHIGNTEVTFGALLALDHRVGPRLRRCAAVSRAGSTCGCCSPPGFRAAFAISIKTGVGYIGILVAALAAFSYAGFNLSNLAIVAGALSVGIGFGLQNLISNFVSGVILLAERPIRVGDLVVVGGEQGYVRKISVRSTELETFDRANVLIPNSYFISEKVKNWTFRNNVCRISITVGVAYGSDARQVRAALLAVAQKTPRGADSAGAVGHARRFRCIEYHFHALRIHRRHHQERRYPHRSGDRRSWMLLPRPASPFPPGEAEITIRNLDSLREMIAQNASAPPGKSPSNGGSKSPGEAVSAKPNCRGCLARLCLCDGIRVTSNHLHKLRLHARWIAALSDSSARQGKAPRESHL